MSKYLLWNFEWFIAHTERAFDNMVISLYGAYQRTCFWHTTQQNETSIKRTVLIVKKNSNKK